MKKILLVSLLLFISCSNSDETLIIYNANGYTLVDENLVQFSTLIIKNGKVLEIGDDSLLNNHNGKKIDLAGKTLLPGLIDVMVMLWGLDIKNYK